MLPGQDKEDILKRLFSPEGDLCFALGRFPMNANDFHETGTVVTRCRVILN